MNSLFYDFSNALMCRQVLVFYTSVANTPFSSTFCIVISFVDWVWWGLCVEVLIPMCIGVFSGVCSTTCIGLCTRMLPRSVIASLIVSWKDYEMLKRHCGLKAYSFIKAWDFFLKSPTILSFWLDKVYNDGHWIASDLSPLSCVRASFLCYCGIIVNVVERKFHPWALFHDVVHECYGALLFLSVAKVLQRVAILECECYWGQWRTGKDLVMACIRLVGDDE